jgi:hypothetical protein
MLEQLVRAQVDFKATYNCEAERMAMHPKLAELILLGVEAGSVTIPHDTKVGHLVSAIYGVKVIEDVHVPVGLVKFSNGKRAGQLWLTQYKDQ